MDTPTTLLTGIAMGESPRWHGDRLWFSDWGARQIVVVRHDGQREITDVPFELPFCIDWLHDDRLLIVAGREGRLVRREFDGSQVPTPICVVSASSRGTRLSWMVAVAST